MKKKSTIILKKIINAIILLTPLIIVLFDMLFQYIFKINALRAFESNNPPEFDTLYNNNIYQYLKDMESFSYYFIDDVFRPICTNSLFNWWSVFLNKLGFGSVNSFGTSVLLNLKYVFYNYPVYIIAVEFFELFLTFILSIFKLIEKLIKKISGGIEND